jgi:hypothetical protein
MITPKGQIKLLDFGIAKNTDTQSADYTQTGTSQNMGTPMYMSPEQIKSTKGVTLQSDIYSLGVVLWQMVMGKKPYDTNTTSTFELQMKIVQDDLPSTSKFWDSIIQKASAKDIGKRYNNCMELRQILDNITNKRDNIKEDQTILSNSNDRIVIEENIKVKKTPTVRKKKNSGSTKEDITRTGDLGKNFTVDREQNNKELHTGSKAKEKRKLLIFTFIFGVISICFIIYQVNSNTNKSNETLTVSSESNSVVTQNKNIKNKENTDATQNKNENTKHKESTVNNVDNSEEEELNFNGFPFYKTSIKINPYPKGGSQNVFFDKNYTLFDLIKPNEPIFPVNKNGKIVYQIYYSSNEDPNPYYGEFTPSELQSHLYYKFKNKKNCVEFCRNKKAIVWQGQNGQGLNSIFKKTSSNEWFENNENGNYYYNEIKGENGNYTLQDKNRAGVYIYLSADKAYYKDNSSSEWIYIYYGQFK